MVAALAGLPAWKWEISRGLYTGGYLTLIMHSANILWLNPSNLSFMHWAKWLMWKINRSTKAYFLFPSQSPSFNFLEGKKNQKTILSVFSVYTSLQCILQRLSDSWSYKLYKNRQTLNLQSNLSFCGIGFSFDLIFTPLSHICCCLGCYLLTTSWTCGGNKHEMIRLVNSVI